MRARLLAVAVLLLSTLPLRAYGLAMQISNLHDFSIPTWSLGDPAISSSLDICIYGLNIPALTSYAITATSSPAGYKISNGSQTIPYSLSWDDGGSGHLGASGGTALSDGIKLTLRQNPSILLTNCGGSPNARLNLKITQASMAAALSGTYNGTVTLLLTPN